MPLRDLRRRRLELGMTQEDLATKAGLSDRTVKRMEAGMPARPSTARAVEGALDRETSVRVLAERMAGTGGFAIPRPLTAGVDIGFRIEPFTMTGGGRAWRVTRIMIPGIAYDGGLRPHDMAASPDALWTFVNLADAMVALVLLDQGIQRMEAGIPREWGHGDDVGYVRPPRFVRLQPTQAVMARG